MRIKFIFILLSSFLLVNVPHLSGQNHSIQFRMNMIGDHYENVPSLFVTDGYIIPAEDKKEINNHLFSLKNGINEEKGRKISHYSYYYLGIGYVNYLKGNYFFRARIDRFYLKRKYNLFGFEVDDLGNSSSYDEYYKSTISTIQYTIGFGKKISWKFLDFLPGLEMLVHYRGDKEETIDITTKDTSGTNDSYSYRYDPGEQFIGLSLLGAVNFNIAEHIAIGLEASVGMAGVNFEQMGFVFHYPSLSFSYSFGDLKSDTPSDKSEKKRGFIL